MVHIPVMSDTYATCKPCQQVLLWSSSFWTSQQKH